MDKEKKNYISGIYNYCDRWCEKCRFTSNCLLFSQESRISTHEILHNGDMSNIDEVFKKELDELENSGDQDDFDFEDEDLFSDEEPELFEDFKDEENEIPEKTNYLEDLSNEYLQKAHSLLISIDKKYSLFNFPREKLTDPFFKNLHENFEIISWFHSFICVKIKRALSCKDEMKKEEDEEMRDISKYDMDGTAKIAIIGINKSVKALNNLYSILTEFSTEISELLILLGKILNLAEAEFPDYHKLIRPGFDTEN